MGQYELHLMYKWWMHGWMDEKDWRSLFCVESSFSYFQYEVLSDVLVENENLVTKPKLTHKVFK